MNKPKTGALSAAYPTQAQNRGLTPISWRAALERSACAPFIKERRMECINATSLRRKSGQVGHPRFVAGIRREDKGEAALTTAAAIGNGQSRRSR